MEAPYAAYPQKDGDLFAMVLRQNLSKSFQPSFLNIPLSPLDYHFEEYDAHGQAIIELRNGFHDGLWHSLV